MSQFKKEVSKILNQVADTLEFGQSEKKVIVGLTTFESEHGSQELIKAANMARKYYSDIEIILISLEDHDDFKTFRASNLEESHKIMEKLLDTGEIDAAVTLHYNFPINVSSVGKIIIPANGREMFIATTTGTSAHNRVEAMVRNAIYGIAVAKASGLEEPTVGILNVQEAPQGERHLKTLAKKGYPIRFAETVRAYGGSIMRGNDLLSGSADVMVTDTLTGNLLMKIFSAFTTGGNYEISGYGYGPGIGEGYNRIINIISRASGAPVISNAIRYAADMAKQGKLLSAVSREITLANKAGLNELFITKQNIKKTAIESEIKPPKKKVVDKEISGIDILEIEDAVKVLWSRGIYAESGMGCTGPVIMVAADEYTSALEVLKDKEYI
jgi:ABC-type amino acid transport substrate-binding protein